MCFESESQKKKERNETGKHTKIHSSKTLAEREKIASERVKKS